MNAQSSSSVGDVYLSVIIPAYNEEEGIEKTVRHVREYLRAKNFPREVLVVDDGSTDKTVSIVQNLMLEMKSLGLIRHRVNEGKGWAVRTGMLAARGKYRLSIDADNPNCIEYFERMQKELEAGTDVVIGSRTAYPREALLRSMLGFVFQSMVRILFGLDVSDVRSGFKAFSAKAAKELFAAQRLPGRIFDIELLMLAKKKKFKITEVPLAARQPARSRFLLLKSPQVFIDLMRLRLRL